MALSLTQRWLTDAVQPYPNRQRVYADADATLARYPTLRPKADVYTFDDGRTQLLVCLHGLLPITFRGAAYNIPIAVWLTRDYPRQPPIAYVIPTNDMLVKPGRYVDVSGRCDIEYTQQWQRKDEGCNLSALLAALQDQFAQEPPVYAKPKNAPPNDPYAARPPPPLPSSHPPALSAPPVLPSKPPSLSPPSALAGNVTYASIPLQSQNPASPPPIPPHPPIPGPLGYTYRANVSSIRATSDPPSFAPAPQALRRDTPLLTSHLHSSPPPPRLSQSQPVSPPPPPPPPPQVHLPVQPIPHFVQIPQPHGPTPTYPHPPPPPPPAPYEQLRPNPSRAPIPDLLDEDDASVSTVSAANNTGAAAAGSSIAPPRPPNPELLRLQTEVHQKLTSELNSLSQALAIDAERLRAQQADLLAGEPAIKDEMARLEAVRDVCRSVADRTRAAVAQAEANITELRRKGDPEVDELVCATSIVHNQLINLIADDNAIEDTIYHLHRALNAGRIDLERFLRATRVLAEEQFMKRALIEKIQNSVSSSGTPADWGGY
ncbi:UEV-domain-containing protein [Pholiota conissans]|uniref:UEV-domain-containing protein n=1 Tax=Pholiota conissans TaxID=109636 RepID=A0A9P6D1E6_9AGAR|nr:UEV-domain-containing protein [Pholiota conissans]